MPWQNLKKVIQYLHELTLWMVPKRRVNRGSTLVLPCFHWLASLRPHIGYFFRILVYNLWTSNWFKSIASFQLLLLILYNFRSIMIQINLLMKFLNYYKYNILFWILFTIYFQVLGGHSNDSNGRNWVLVNIFTSTFKSKSSSFNTCESK